MSDIKALAEERDKLIDALEKGVGNIGDRAYTDAEEEAFAAVTYRVEVLNEQIKSANKAAEAKAARDRHIHDMKASAAKPLEDTSTPNKAPATIYERGEKLEKGIAAARAMRCLAAGGGKIEGAEKVAKKWYGSDDIVMKAMVSSDLTAGGAMIAENFMAEIVELLRPRSVVRSLGPRTVDLTGGNVTMPKITSGATASYIGEAQQGRATELTLGQVRLSSKKLRALVPISNDLIRRASADADTVVRDDMIEALAQAEDLNFIRGQGTEFAPKGLRYHAAAANVFAANGTVNLANVTEDLDALPGKLEDADVVIANGGWIMSPRTKRYLMSLRDGNGNYAFRDEMNTGMLNGYPYRLTTQVPNNLGGNESELYFANFSDVLLGQEGGMEVAVSDQASFLNASGNAISAFDADLTVMRVIARHDMNVRHAESVAVLTGVTWGA